ncbi:MAG: hypothetical protein ABUK15_09530, partial [Anaerolineales bacterium]
MEIREVERYLSTMESILSKIGVFGGKITCPHQIILRGGCSCLIPTTRLIEHKVMQSKCGNWFAGCHTIEAMRRNGCGSGIVMR